MNWQERVWNPSVSVKELRTEAALRSEIIKLMEELSEPALKRLKLYIEQDLWRLDKLKGR